MASPRARPLIAIALTALAGCTTARVERFERFAEAGAAWAAAVEAFVPEAGGATIDADSAVLEKTRPQLPDDERAEAVLEHDALLRERVEILAGLRRHAALLGTYFEALAALAGSDAPREAGAAAAELAGTLEALSARLEDRSVGDASIASFSQVAVEIAVAGYRHAALEAELRARAPTIERELDFQQAAMSALASAMRTDLAAVLAWREQSELVEPYAGSGRLPASWARRRREILGASAAAESADAAVEATRNLRKQFVALVEHRFEAGDFLALLTDVNQVLTLLERLRALRGDEG